MKSCSKLLLRPLCFFTLLVLSSLMISKLLTMSNTTDHQISFLSHKLFNTSISQIENVAKHLVPLNSSSASSLARTLSSSLNDTELSFGQIQSKVAPSLFLALSVLPYSSHVSYIGQDGLMFSYYNSDNNKDATFAVFSNSSMSSHTSGCFAQPVNRDTGQMYGQAVRCDTIKTVNVTLVQDSVNTTEAFPLSETVQNNLFLYNVAMDGRGVISIGYPTNIVSAHFSGLDFNGGDFFLATRNGHVLMESKLHYDTRVDVKNGTVSLETVNRKGDVVDKSGYYSCKKMKIRRNKHEFYCSTIQIGGIQSVYVLAFPIEIYAHKNRVIAVMLLALVLATVVVSVSAFVFLVIRYSRREMFLCAALVKQMDSTQQAERKSMNKSLAFARASHDIRASLAAITGLIDHCHEDRKLNSNLAANLSQMNDCANDLLGILNSVLDTSKIEAGKMQLEEEEFNVAQLLEDVVDMFYPISMKKGVDVILDPCDGSILKFSLVRGDRMKLKQILCNLLSNATKFTTDGHISVRAMVRKTSIENAIIASNRKSMLKYCLSRMCNKNRGNLSTSLEGLHTVQDRNPNSMEYIFEVDDTGKGISKERQRSVFEDFVQVKETAHGQLGTGLGLGIVQSLVRLMGGEIKIIDKEQGEKGTCFRFNVFLTACHSAEGDIEEQVSYTNTDIHRYFGMNFQSLSPRSDASHVVLFIAGEERGKISKRLLQSLGVKVLVVKRTVDFFHALERIKQTLEDPVSINFSSEICVVDTLHRSLSQHSSDRLSSSGPKDILVVIDANAAPVSELSPILSVFRKEVQNIRCKLVWFENPFSRNDGLTAEPHDVKTMTRLCDHVLKKPLHGSHLYRVLGLLPEFGGVFQSNINPIGKSKSQAVEVKTMQVSKNEGVQKPLDGKNILVVEDNITLCMLSTRILCKLGATTHACENGKEALDLVIETLKNRKGTLPFDYIFMDCEMPVMDGLEATRLIRKEEEVYGVRTPIIALTSYSTVEEISLTSEAGMDLHLVKPLRIDNVLKVIMNPSC